MKDESRRDSCDGPFGYPGEPAEDSMNQTIKIVYVEHLEQWSAETEESLYAGYGDTPQAALKSFMVQVASDTLRGRSMVL